MHQLGDQWIDIIDGQDHMVKAVKGEECLGCMFGSARQEINTSDDGDSEWVSYIHSCSSDCCPFDTDELVIKDLGIFNAEGFLPIPWDRNQYPMQEVYGQGKDGKATLIELSFYVRERKIVFGLFSSEQDAKDAWNRRE